MVSARRIILTTLFGLVFGIVCWGLAQSGETPPTTGIALFIILSRTVMGFAMGVSGLRMAWWLHAILFGVIFSLPMGFSVLDVPNGGVGLLFGSIVMGIIYALLIEVVTGFIFKAKLGAGAK